MAYTYKIENSGNCSTGSITIAIFKPSKFDKLQTSSNPDPSSSDLSKPCLFPPAESSETWNHITVMNERVGLSSDMGDEWSSQTARKEQSDNARFPGNRDICENSYPYLTISSELSAHSTMKVSHYGTTRCLNVSI
ncbi:hypothetical protein HAX54_003725 [Datura stramonium]|uniref:Uncharacterized protein n=1 Tax=Datura stramonium TaxID=4076 RepID=A0ABS8T5R1_DATST|nr:hypothetical protein [Datura stramonium]